MKSSTSFGMGIAMLSTQLLMPVLSHSAESAGHFGFAAQLDAEFGGDDLIDVTFTNGRTQTMYAGQGLAINVGAHYRPAHSKFDFVSTIGYKYVTTAASNADLHLERVPIKLLAYYDFTDAWWMGAGPILHTNVHFKGDGFLPDVNFSDAVGFTVQAGWRWIGIGYTNIGYDAEAPYRGSVDASNFGIYLQWRGR